MMVDSESPIMNSSMSAWFLGGQHYRADFVNLGICCWLILLEMLMQLIMGLW